MSRKVSADFDLDTTSYCMLACLRTLVSAPQMGRTSICLLPSLRASAQYEPGRSSENVPG
jgi:hypothetical protein